MKRNILIAVGALYLIIIAVILVIGLSGDGPLIGTDAPEVAQSVLTDEVANVESLPPLMTSSPVIKDEDSTQADEVSGDDDDYYPADDRGFFIWDENGYPFDEASYPLDGLYTQGSGNGRTSMPVRTATPIRTPTRTAAHPTATRTPTPTAPPGWVGDWTVYLGPEGGPYAAGSLSITIDGDKVSASAMIRGESYDFIGTLASNEIDILGDFTNNGTSGWFSWTFISNGQFGGTLENQQAFCAARAGFGKPDPCGYFILS